MAKSIIVYFKPLLFLQPVVSQQKSNSNQLVIRYLVESEVKSNSVDDVVTTIDINGEVRSFSEGLLSNNGIIHKVLPDGITVSQWSVQGVKGGVGDVTGLNLTLNDVHLDNIGSHGSTKLFVRFTGIIGGSEDGV